MTTMLDDMIGRLPGGADGTVSYVLGDMVGSTRLWESHAADMPAALARLDALVDEHLAARGGHRPPEQGEGDNFVAVFATATEAVAFAWSLQAAVCAQQWPGGLPLSIRIAVHAGEARRRDGGRFMGEPLNRCARLRALGHGGQILLSGAVTGLVVGHLRDGLFLRDLGTQSCATCPRPSGWPSCAGRACPPTSRRCGRWTGG
jgi:class 3 adenylate cyclase